MSIRSTLFTAATTFITVFGLTAAANAQSRIYGTLEPVRSSGPCPSNMKIPTDNAVSRVMGIWFLFDRKDDVVSSRGIELSGGYRSSFPTSFVSAYKIVPNTIMTYTTSHSFSGWDKRKKTVTMLKQSWLYTGWGSSTRIYCYAAWAGQVKYN